MNAEQNKTKSGLDRVPHHHSDEMSILEVSMQRVRGGDTDDGQMELTLHLRHEMCHAKSSTVMIVK